MDQVSFPEFPDYTTTYLSLLKEKHDITTPLISEAEVWKKKLEHYVQNSKLSIFSELIFRFKY